MKNKGLKLIAGRAGQNFGSKLATQFATTLSPCQTIVFSDGNIFVEIGEDIHGQDAIVVQSLYNGQVNEFFMELLFLIDACKRYNAASITVIIPFFSYAKADKQDGDGTSIRARVCADALQTAGATRVMMMDLHSPSIPGFFSVPTENLSAMKVLCDHLRAFNLDNLVAVSPDAGFAKQARRYAAYLGIETVIVDKNRPDHSERPDIMEIIGNVANKNCVIFDDFTTSGGTLIEVSQALVKQGAQGVYAAVSHAPITVQTLEKINNSPIQKLITTNSVDNLQDLAHPKLEVLDVSELFASAY